MTIIFSLLLLVLGSCPREQLTLITTLKSEYRKASRPRVAGRGVFTVHTEGLSVRLRHGEPSYNGRKKQGKRADASAREHTGQEAARPAPRPHGRRGRRHRVSKLLRRRLAIFLQYVFLTSR